MHILVEFEISNNGSESYILVFSPVFLGKVWFLIKIMTYVEHAQEKSIISSGFQRARYELFFSLNFFPDLK